MRDKRVTVFARIKAEPGHESAVRQGLLALPAPTRVEGGCLNYDLHESLADPGTFRLHENWTSRAAPGTRFQSPHARRFVARVEPLLAEPVEIDVCEVIPRAGGFRHRVADHRGVGPG
jgi:quinol monooxygenase YgiN